MPTMRESRVVGLEAQMVAAEWRIPFSKEALYFLGQVGVFFEKSQAEPLTFKSLGVSRDVDSSSQEQVAGTGMLLMQKQDLQVQQQFEHGCGLHRSCAFQFAFWPEFCQVVVL